MRILIVIIGFLALSGCSLTQGTSQQEDNKSRSLAAPIESSIKLPTIKNLELLSPKGVPPLESKSVLSFRSNANVKSISTFVYCGKKLFRKGEIDHFEERDNKFYWEYTFPFDGMDATCLPTSFAFVPRICGISYIPGECIEEWRAAITFTYQFSMSK